MFRIVTRYQFILRGHLGVVVDVDVGEVGEEICKMPVRDMEGSLYTKMNERTKKGVAPASPLLNS